MMKVVGYPNGRLNATETTTMVGDPAGIILADTYLRGIQDFDVEKAYEAMTKSATQLENNALRPGIKEYIERGYLTTAYTKSGSVSTTQEYNITDFAIAQLAEALNKKEDEVFYRKRSISYRKLFDKEFNLLRPREADASWVRPFNPEIGANFQKNLGFIEGNSWQYTFMVAHDTKGLMQLMGGEEGRILISFKRFLIQGNSTWQTNPILDILICLIMCLVMSGEHKIKSLNSLVPISKTPPMACPEMMILVPCLLG